MQHSLIRSLLVRGMIVGLIAGLLSFGFAKLFGEPEIDRAIAFEEKMDQAEGKAPEPELVSRAVQSRLGLLTAVVVYSTAIGGLFSLAFAAAYGRYGIGGAKETAALLGAAGFLAVALTPAMKYPPNPPSVGLAETIGWRTEWYFMMVLISLTATAFAFILSRRLAGRFGAWNSALIGAGVFIGILAICLLILPAINEVPLEFPAAVLWRFRIASLGTQSVLWATLGLLFGALTERDPEFPRSEAFEK